MSDSTTPQDDAAMSPASTGSVGKAFGEELLFQKAESGTLTPSEQRSLARRSRERKCKIAGWCEQNARLHAENERLREAIRRLAEQDATLSVVGGNVIVEMDATLTDAERQALEWAAAIAKEAVDKRLFGWEADKATAATLRVLLERLPCDK